MIGSVTLTDTEQAACDEIARREDELVELLRALIRFDTTTHDAGRAAARRGGAPGATSPPGSRGRGRGGRRLGARRRAVAGHPMVPDGFTFAGRPQLAARFAGAGGGRTLLLNGHIDVVAVEPRDALARTTRSRPSSRTAPCTAAARAT